MKFPQSNLFHHHVGKLHHGVEIGGSAHNEYRGPGKINVDITGDMFTVYKLEEERLCGEKLPVDIVAAAWQLPFADNSMDYLVASHVLEHCWDLIGTVREWLRVVRKNGIIFIVFPHKERTFDKDRECTSIQELIDRHEGRIKNPHKDAHHTVFVTDNMFSLAWLMNWRVIDYVDVDDVCGNGFTFVISKHGDK